MQPCFFSFLFVCILHVQIFVIGFDLNMEAPHDGLDLNLPLEDENHVADQGGIDLNLEPPVAAARK